MRWLRLYTETSRDRKLRRLPASQRWLWVVILIIAADSPVPGWLFLSEDLPVTIDDLADEAAISNEEVEAGLEAMVAQNMIELRDGAYHVINWDKRQFSSDSSTERVQRHRNSRRSMKHDCNVTVTPPETDTETETDLFNITCLPPDDPEPETEQDPIPYQEIIDHLNTKAGTNYKPTSKDTKKHVHARWAEGYRLNDFKLVIDNKARDWIGTDREIYLRPQTLFGPKFEGYLNQRRGENGRAQSHDPPAERYSLFARSGGEEDP